MHLKSGIFQLFVLIMKLAVRGLSNCFLTKVISNPFSSINSPPPHPHLIKIPFYPHQIKSFYQISLTTDLNLISPLLIKIFILEMQLINFKKQQVLYHIFSQQIFKLILKI